MLLSLSAKLTSMAMFDGDADQVGVVHSLVNDPDSETSSEAFMLSTNLHIDNNIGRLM